MRDDREQLKQLIAVKKNLDSNTAEGQADNAKFNYLYRVAWYKDTGKTYFYEIIIINLLILLG